MLKVHSLAKGGVFVLYQDEHFTYSYKISLIEGNLLIR